MSYLDKMEPIGSVLAADLDIAVYSMDAQIYQVFLTNHLVPLMGTTVDNGGLAIGSYSPASVIPMDEHTRKIANIPDDAVYLAWAYPISGLCDVPDMIKRKLDASFPAVSFALFGGFLFFGEAGNLLQANGMFSGNNISFGPPKELKYSDVYGTLGGTGRLQDVTSQELLDMNVDKSCWILPSEKIGMEVIAPYGGFMYVYKDTKVQYFEVVEAHPEQEYNPFVENKTPFNTIQNCLRYLETEFDEKLDGLSEKDIIIKLTQRCNKLKDKVDELQDVFACKECLSNPQDVAFNCGHMLCQDCAKQKNIGAECPICRDPIESKLNLYYS
jgi:hypothetical protein